MLPFDHNRVRRRQANRGNAQSSSVEWRVQSVVISGRSYHIGAQCMTIELLPLPAWGTAIFRRMIHEVRLVSASFKSSLRTRLTLTYSTLLAFAMMCCINSPLTLTFPILFKQKRVQVIDCNLICLVLSVSLYYCCRHLHSFVAVVLQCMQFHPVCVLLASSKPLRWIPDHCCLDKNLKVYLLRFFLFSDICCFVIRLLYGC